MSIEALLAILITAGLICLMVGAQRVVKRDRSALDKRLRRYGGRAFQLTDDEQKRAASQQVTQMLAKRVEASLSGRTFAAALQTDLARANLRLTVGEFVIMQVAAALVAGLLAWLISGAPFVGSVFAALGWFIPKIWLGRRQAGRLKAFNNQLADTIALMSNSLRSGLSLVQAMEMICCKEASATIPWMEGTALTRICSISATGRTRSPTMTPMTVRMRSDSARTSSPAMCDWMGSTMTFASHLLGRPTAWS